MPAAKVNLTIEQGATFVQEIILKDSTGIVRDISNWMARGMIREDYTDQFPIATFQCFVDGPNGKIVFELDSIITAGLNFVSAVYDIELVENGTSPENVQRVVQGSVYLSKEATR